MNKRITSRLRKKRRKAIEKQIYSLRYLRVLPLPIGVITRLAADLIPGEIQTGTIEFTWTSGKGPTYFPNNGEIENGN